MYKRQGKTFAAGCLANFVMHDGKVPLVTSVSRAENVLWDAKGDERTRVLEGIRSYDLVVIDDLGAERDSSYMDSRAFDLSLIHIYSGLVPRVSSWGRRLKAIWAIVAVWNSF